MTSVEPAAGARRPSLLYRLNHTPLRDVLRGRLSSRLDTEAPIVAAALPEPLATLVRQTVRRTRLSRFERADVARELAAHFQDGLQAGHAPDTLATAFGDAVQAARLIRRAKQRCRSPVARTVALAVRAAQIVVLLLLVVYVVQALRLYTGTIRITRNYLAEWNAPALAVPEAERAWPIYRQAALATPPWPGALADADLRPGGKRWPEVVAFVQGQAKALELYRRAAAMPALGAILAAEDDPELDWDYARAMRANTRAVEHLGENPPFLAVAASVPQAPVLRSAGRLLAVDALAAAEDGDGARALADVEALFGLAGHSFQLRLLLGDLVGLGITRLSCDTLGRLVCGPTGTLLTEAQLGGLSARLAALGGGGRLRVNLASEHAVFEDVVQRYYTDDGHDEGLACPTFIVSLTNAGPRGDWLPTPSGSKLLTPVLTTLIAGRREMLAEYRELMARGECEANVPLWQREPSLVERDVARMGASWVAGLRYLPIVVCMPSYSQPALHAEYTTQIRDATLVRIALELYRRRHGAWPTALDNLTPQWLAQVPPDRYDGRPLKYRVIEGQPVLYSVGVDRDDDGGRLPEGKQANPRAHAWRPVSDLRPRPDDPSWQAVPDGDWILWPPVD